MPSKLEKKRSKNAATMINEREWLLDTIQGRSNLNFDVKSATIQFYGNNYNSQSDRWIGPKVYEESLDMFFYIGLKFQILRSLGRHCNTGQQRLYKFCYLLRFD